jgi:hypothetical protein
MYRVMSFPPLPNGMYEGSSGADAENDEAGPFEVVFRVPRLQAHMKDGIGHYTIVLPKYAADELRQQAYQQHEEQNDISAPLSDLSPCSASSLCVSA